MATGITSRWHLEAARSSLDKNVQYCSKGTQSHDEWQESNELGPNWGVGAETFEFGTPPRGQGKRTDLDAVAKAVSEGCDLLAIENEHGKFVLMIALVSSN